MSEQRRGLPPGPNVGTQLRALRARKARADRERAVAEAGTDIGSQALEAHRAPQARQLALPSAEGWFAAHGWQPFEFQRAVWSHVAAGRSGLLHATTGSGKTYAVWFGAIARAAVGPEWAAAPSSAPPNAVSASKPRPARKTNSAPS